MKSMRKILFLAVAFACGSSFAQTINTKINFPQTPFCQLYHCSFIKNLPNTAKKGFTSDIYTLPSLPGTLITVYKQGPIAKTIMIDSPAPGKNASDFFDQLDYIHVVHSSLVFDSTKILISSNDFWNMFTKKQILKTKPYTVKVFSLDHNIMTKIDGSP